MAESMLKAVPTVSTEPVDSKPVGTSEPISRTLVYEGVPLELMHYFNVEMRNISEGALKHLGEIYNLMDGKNKQMGDLITEIRKVENKLGQPSNTETRYGRVWHYLKLTNRINDLEKQRGAFANG